MEQMLRFLTTHEPHKLKYEYKTSIQALPPGDIYQIEFNFLLFSIGSVHMLQ